MHKHIHKLAYNFNNKASNKTRFGNPKPRPKPKWALRLSDQYIGMKVNWAKRGTTRQFGTSSDK